MHPIFHLLLFYLNSFLNFLRDFIIFQRASKPFRLSKLPYVAQKEILLSMDLYTILSLSMCSKSMRRIAGPHARKFPNPSSDVGPLFTLYQDKNWFMMFFDCYKTSKYEIEKDYGQYIGSDIVTAANFLIDFYKLKHLYFISRDGAYMQESKLELIFDFIGLHSSQLKTVCIQSIGSSHLPLAKILKKWNRFDQFSVCFGLSLVLTIGKTEVVFKYFKLPTIGSIWEDCDFKSLEVDPDTILDRNDLKDCIRRWMNSGGQQSGTAHFVARYRGMTIRKVLESVCPVETLKRWNHEKYGRIDVSFRIRRRDSRQATIFLTQEKDEYNFHMYIDDCVI